MEYNITGFSHSATTSRRMWMLSASRRSRWVNGRGKTSPVSRKKERPEIRPKMSKCRNNRVVSCIYRFVKCPATRTGPCMAPIVYTLAFVGGFCIMSLELLGGRVLAPYFGSSIYVWGSIITVFMLSLSFGYLLGGRL